MSSTVHVFFFYCLLNKNSRHILSWLKFRMTLDLGNFLICTLMRFITHVSRDIMTDQKGGFLIKNLANHFNQILALGGLPI